MALLATLTLTDNVRVSTKLKNHNVGKPDEYTYYATGDFGSGTVSVQLSPDGTNWIDNIDNGSAVTFGAADARRIVATSSEQSPVYLGFDLNGATAPSITIKVYDNQ